MSSPSPSARSATSWARAHRLDPVWDVSLTDAAYIVLGNVLGMLIGFMLGVLIRNSAGAIVAYFVYTLVLPPLSGLLAGNQALVRDSQPWVDFNFAQGALFNGDADRRAVGAARRRQPHLAGHPPPSASGWCCAPR